MRSYRVLVILAVVFALAAAFLSLRTIQTYVGQVKVLAAATDLSSDQLVSASDLKWVNLPKGALYQDTVINPAQAEGTVVRGFIPAGTVLRQSMLEQEVYAGIPGKLAQLSQSGTQYFAVALPENISTTIGGQVQTGEHVDIYLTNSTTPVAGDVVVLSGIPMTTTNQPTNAQQGIVVALNAQEQAAVLPYLSQTSNNKASLVLEMRPGKGA